MVLAGLVESFGLIGLFIVTFLSASVIPFPSEPVIVGALLAFPADLVFIVAILGGLGGSLTNYYLGYKGVRYVLFKLFRRQGKKEKKARKFINKYGILALLFAPWIPMIGDPLVIVFGTLKSNFTRFLIFITLGWIIKIAIIVYVGEAFLGAIL